MRIRAVLFAVLLPVLAIAWLALAADAGADQAVLYYPKRPDSPRWNYALGLIELALKESGRDYVLRPTAEEMSQTRAARELELGNIDFIWTGTSAEYEQRFRAIRIPVLRGLDGYRICIIDPAHQSVFSAVKTLANFQQLTIGQDPGWSDVKILDAAGFKIVTAPYDSLFEMVERDRFDCFLRGAHEAPTEVAKHPGLAVESDLLIVYPFTSFFFVNKGDTTLAEDLEDGLKKAYADGSFMAYFNSHPTIKAIFEQARIDRRRRFDIPNHMLTDETRAIPAEYWEGR
ncbi:MAG: transporter substrate-binding domain-containing protein [Dongiaceae bacterium]